LFIEGSSETTSEISNYNTFNTYVISSNHPQFIPWFIGFFEGDGSFLFEKIIQAVFEKIIEAVFEKITLRR
jgi:hypothetical protein